MAQTLTGGWFDHRGLESIAERYATYPASALSYATVRDYVDSFEHLGPLAAAQGDLKDAQRPWALKTVISSVPRRGRVLEIGAGQPYVADLLARLGYEVWLVDPYDGSGNGPVEYEYFLTQCPDVKFVRALFTDELDDVPEKSFDCIYSISVLEHIDRTGLEQVARGMQRFLKPEGSSIHAIDHVHRGNGAAEHLEKTRFIVDRFGLQSAALDRMLVDLSVDTETYYLSAESHNRWRGTMPYDQFPMRVCVSIQLVTDAEALTQ